MSLYSATASASKNVLERASVNGDIKVRQIYQNWAGFSCDVTESGLNALLSDPDVLSVEATQKAYAQTKQGIPLMGAYDASRRRGYAGAGVAVAIVDTGVDYTHPQLGGSAKIGDFPNEKVIGGHNFGDADYPNDPHPCVATGAGHPHGTCCAGISSGDIPSEADNAGNFIGGVAPESKVYALKITKADEGSSDNDTIAAAWDWCVAHKNDDPANPLLVISTSFGGGYYEEACDEDCPSLFAAATAANAAGITVFASSGNDGFCNAIASPSALSNVISVGAVYDASFGKVTFRMSQGTCLKNAIVTDTTAADKVTCYSNSSVTLLDMFAPSHNATTCNLFSLGIKYSPDFGGTSAACPYAAGGAVVLQQTAYKNTGSYLTPEDVKAKLCDTGDFITDKLKNANVRKPRVNIGKAISEYLPQTGFLKVVIDPEEVRNLGATWTADGGATWHKSGEEIELPSGDAAVYTVEFKEVTAWQTPDPQLTKLTLGETTTLTGKYVSLESFDIELYDTKLKSNSDKSYAPGDTFDFAWTVLATDPITKPFWLELFVSKTGGFDIERTGTAITDSYKVQKMTDLLKTFELTRTLKPIADGHYTLMPSVNRGSISDALFEYYYSNNWMPLVGKRLRVHNTKNSNIDLGLNDTKLAYSDTNPNEVRVTGLLLNNGTEDLLRPGCWIEVFYGTLTAEGRLMPQGTIGNGFKVDNLIAGGNLQFTLTGSIPGGAKNKALAVVADSTNIVPEYCESNNFELLYDPALLPVGKDNGIDLAVKSIEIIESQVAPKTVAPRDELEFSVQVENKGTTVPEGNVYLELFASQNGGASLVPGVTMTWSKLIDPPAIGETKTYSLTQTINSIGDGIYTPVVIVNRDGAGNNPGDMTPLDNCMVSDQRPISILTPNTVKPTANLVWSDGPYFSTDYDTETITVSGRIKNTGTERTQPFWTEAFIGTKQYATEYFYKQAGAVFAAGAYCESLAPGFEKDIKIVGPYVKSKIIGVLTDSTDVVAETDETDNYGYSSLTE